MKRPSLTLLVTVTMIAIFVCLGGTAGSEEAVPLDVREAAICLAVVDRTCVDGNTLFPASVVKLYCFTRICGAQGQVDINHVWYFGEIERARIELGVDSVSWRTNSSKIIQPHEIGDWHVDVVGPNDELLKAVDFEIVE